jgi:hypothetical protein
MAEKRKLAERAYKSKSGYREMYGGIMDSFRQARSEEANELER